MTNYLIKDKDMNQNSNLKAVAFARVSTREQQDGYSIGGQLHRIQQYCKNKNIPIITTYTPAESSTRGARKTFFEMLEFVKKQKTPIAIICDKVDRLQRGFKEYSFIMDLVDNHSTQLHFVTEGEIISKNSSGHEFLMYHMNILLAEGCVRNLSDNVKRGMREMPSKGEYFHTAPVGYLNQRTNRHQTTIIIDPIMGPIVRKIFSEFSTGIYSLADITRLANKLKLKTVRGTIAHKQTIRSMLSNPFYYGEMKMYGKLYKHNYEHLISKATFQRCQEILSRKAVHKKRKIEDTYRGLIHCKNCGSLITPDVKIKPNGRVHKYLFCPHCKGTRINENIVDAKIKDDLCRLKKVPKEWLEKTLNKINQELEAEHKIEKDREKSIKLRIQKYDKMLEVLLDKLLDDSITQEQYDKKNNEIRYNISEATKELQEYSLVARQSIIGLKDLLILISKIPDIYESSNSDEKRKILNLLYSNLFLDGKNPLFSIRKPLENILSRGHRLMWSGQRDCLSLLLTTCRAHSLTLTGAPACAFRLLSNTLSRVFAPAYFVI